MGFGLEDDVSISAQRHALALLLWGVPGDMRILRVLVLPMLNAFIRILVKTYHQRCRCHNKAVRTNEECIFI